MARTLSPAKRKLICFAALAGCALLSAPVSAQHRFQSQKKKTPAGSSIRIRQPEPAPATRTVTAMQLPANTREQARTTAQGPRSSNTAATNFRNPFAANSSKSDAPLLLGPRSRWQTNATSTHHDQRGIAARADDPAIVKSPSVTPEGNRSSSSAVTSEAATSRFTPRYTVPMVSPATEHVATRSTLQILAETPVESNQPSDGATIVADRTTNDSTNIPAVSPASEPLAAEPAGPLAEAEPRAPRQPAVTPLEDKKAMPIRQAILADDTRPATDADLSQLPELQSFPGKAAVTDASRPKAALASPPPLQLPDPRGFTTKPEEPVWLTNGREQSLDDVDVNQDAFEEPKPNIASPAPKVVSSPTLRPPSGLTPDVEAFAEEAANSGDDDEPVIVTDYNESPTDWIAQAQAVYKNAESTDQYMACINLCQRIVNDGSSAEHSSAARKLAAEAYNRRGEMLSEAGNTSEALAEFESALANDPESAQAVHNRAVTLAQDNNFDAAMADFNRVIELNPELAMAYRNRAQLLFAQGKTEEAVVDYTRAIETLKTDAEIYNSRAHALQQLGRFDEAIADLKQSLEIEPQAAATYTQRANLLAERGDYENALADFKKSLELDATSAETHRGLAWLKSTCPVDSHRDAFEALEAARNAVKLSKPDDYLTLEALAAAHANAGEFDKAIDAQRRAINHAPSSASALLKRRLALYELRQPYRAKN